MPRHCQQQDGMYRNCGIAGLLLRAASVTVAGLQMLYGLSFMSLLFYECMIIFDLILQVCSPGQFPFVSAQLGERKARRSVQHEDDFQLTDCRLP